MFTECISNIFRNTISGQFNVETFSFLNFKLKKSHSLLIRIVKDHFGKNKTKQQFFYRKPGILNYVINWFIN